MRQILSLLFLALVITGVGGYYLLFKADQLFIKYEMKKHMRYELNALKLETISASNSKIEWTDSGKEFRLGENMYDIIYTDTVNGKINFHCVNDEDESLLISNYERLIADGLNKNSSSSKSRPLQLLKILSTLIYLPSDVIIFPEKTNSTLFNTWEQPRYKYSYTSITTPPPQELS